MILGRSTVQWTALISSTLAFVQLVLQLAKPEWADEAAIILPALGVVLGGYIAFLAQTATTPMKDPILPSGTTVSVQGTEDKVLIQGSGDTSVATGTISNEGTGA